MLVNDTFIKVSQDPQLGMTKRAFNIKINQLPNSGKIKIQDKFTEEFNFPRYSASDSDIYQQPTTSRSRLRKGS